MAVLVADREDHALAEPVVHPAAALARAGQAHLEQLPGSDLALAGQLPGHLVPAARRPAELVLLDRLIGEAAAAEVRERRGAGLGLHQHGVVEGDRRLEDLAQARVVRVLALGPLVDLDAGATGQRLERLGERQAVTLHQEREDVTVLAAAEAVPRVAGGRHDEARGLLAVERAQSLEGRARLLQLDGLPHHIRDGKPALDLGYDADGQCCSCPDPSGEPRRGRLRACQDLTGHARPRVPPVLGVDKNPCQAPARESVQGRGR